MSHGIVDWRQNAKVEIGDIVFVYVSSPFSCIKYKCRVIENDILPNNVEYGEEYYKNGSPLEQATLYCRLKVETEYPDHTYTITELRELGVKGNIQCQRKLDISIAKMIL